MTSKGEEVLRLAGRMYMIKNEVAIFGGGCFWCTEAVYKILRGIESVVPGYAGGPSTGSGYKPTYEEVSTGTTGHAEVIKIEYDPEQISFLPRTTRHNLTGKGMTWERNIARLFFMQTTNKRRRQRSLLKSWSLQVPTAGISLQK